MKNQTSLYPTEANKPKRFYFREALLQWWPALKIFFLPMVFIFFTQFVWMYATISFSLQSKVLYYTLESLVYMVAIPYFLFYAFYSTHLHWEGDTSGLKERISVFSKQFIHVFMALLLIVIGCVVSFFISSQLLKLVAPYSHFMGRYADIILLVLIGFTTFIWLLITSYWPFFAIRDRCSFMVAYRKSFFAAGLSKNVLSFFFIPFFVCTLILAHDNMPWMRYAAATPALFIAAKLVIYWVLGSYILNFVCLVMNNFDLSIEELGDDSYFKHSNSKKGSDLPSNS